jgi:hypothetical protein
LPSTERNDGKILGEASLVDATYLIASDSHIADIDRFLLKAAYEDQHLCPVDVLSKKEMLKGLHTRISDLPGLSP